MVRKREPNDTDGRRDARVIPDEVAGLNAEGGEWSNGTKFSREGWHGTLKPDGLPNKGTTKRLPGTYSRKAPVLTPAGVELMRYVALKAALVLGLVAE